MKLLDLGCGTGQIALPLADSFTKVLAIDQEEESVSYGQNKTRDRGVANITWVTGAESIDYDRPFELVAIRNAFQLMNRLLVTNPAFSWLEPGGGLALPWGGSRWDGDLPWQGAWDDLFR